MVIFLPRNMIVVLTLLYLAHVNGLTLTKDTLPWPGELTCEKCERVYVPVCGFDGKTYINECRLYCYNEMQDKENRVYFKHYGPCMMIRRRSSTHLVLQEKNSTIPDVMIDVSFVKQNISDAIAILMSNHSTAANASDNVHPSPLNEEFEDVNY